MYLGGIHNCIYFFNRKIVVVVKNNNKVKRIVIYSFLWKMLILLNKLLKIILLQWEFTWLLKVDILSTSNKRLSKKLKLNINYLENILILNI